MLFLCAQRGGQALFLWICRVSWRRVEGKCNVMSHSSRSFPSSTSQAVARTKNRTKDKGGSGLLLLLLLCRLPPGPSLAASAVLLSLFGLRAWNRLRARGGEIASVNAFYCLPKRAKGFLSRVTPGYPMALHMLISQQYRGHRISPARSTFLRAGFSTGGGPSLPAILCPLRVQ